MEHEIERHEWVRFQRSEIIALHSLPSAGQEHHAALSPAPRRLHVTVLRLCGFGIAALAALVLVVLGAVYMVATSDAGGERLRDEARSALSAAFGRPVALRSEAPRFSLGGANLLGLEIPQVALVEADGRPILDAGALRVGVQILPLLSGRFELDSVAIVDARLSAVGNRDAGDPLARLRDDRGLFDPDRVAGALFSALDNGFDALVARGTRSIALEDVVVSLGPDGDRELRVEEAALTQTAMGAIHLSARLVAFGRDVALSGNATRTGEAARQALDFAIEAQIGEPVVAGASAASGAVPLDGDLAIAVTGRRAAASGPGRIEMVASSRDLTVAVPGSEPVEAELDIRAALVEGAGKVEFERLVAAFGRSRYEFHGAIGPAPASDRGAVPAYRYEFISDGSRAAASDVSEPAATVYARVAGSYLPGVRSLAVDEIGVRTTSGEVIGRASLSLPRGLAPSVVLALDIPEMAVAQAKQLWPVEVARGARSWVLANVFGGTLKNSRIRFRVPPGRLGNGIPLNADEITGHFEIDETRFDITGDLPPARDAYGTVDFRGNRVEVGLKSGTVFMPTGRTVNATNGTFLIEDVGHRPLVGRMAIDVAGDAASVVEFASYKPIDAMRHLDFVAADFSGEVGGHVEADIPLQKDIPVETLDWLVSLDYRDLALARPVEGQKVTQAHGSIVVDPDKAVIEADARLNGVDAHISLTEPLHAEGGDRSRDVVLTLDDAAREAIAPALNDMLSGDVKVAVKVAEGGAQRMEADLTAARLAFPWVGWSKGPGIAATASFILTTEGGVTRLSDFRLKGETFAIDGAFTLADGGLSEAKLSRVILNRGDDVAVDIRAAGKGYDIAIRGSAFDARSIIKLYLAETDTAEETVEAIPVKLDAEIGTVTGFGGETVSGVRFALSGTGTDVSNLDIAATSAGGAPIRIVNRTEGGSRSVSMKSSDAGAVLRLLNIYEYMQGGTIDVALQGQGDGPLRGQVDARNFLIVNEPKLKSLVATPPPAGDGRSLNEAVRRDIDVSQVQFERGFAIMEKGPGSLVIDRGVLRGPLIGATFQGTFYDPNDRMDMTGTFMPAYGLNRIFAEIPIVGQILGNGRDRGLIGITFRLAGNAKDPQLQINPLSVIAPGIFRSIFEFD